MRDRQTPDQVAEQNTWEFGQIMPMLLLALPLFQVIEMFYGIFSYPRADFTSF